jgi:hypothetical protein
LPLRSVPVVARVALALAAAALAGSLVVPAVESADAVPVRPMTLPVHHDRIDDVYWSDTWGAPRSGGRSHIGVDMLGPKMVPLVAARSGRVVWGRYDNARGSIVRIRDAEGWEYQYIHLNNDTPGTDNGSATCAQTFSPRLCSAIDSRGNFSHEIRVSEGEIIGYMGDGGNAEWTASHLHFEVYKPAGDGGVTPINPTPSVNAARDQAEAGVVPGGPPLVAAPGETGFVDHLWYRLHGRYPTAKERERFEATAGASGVWEAIAVEVDDETAAAMIDRLYLAFFLRYPDTEGISHWIESRAAGHSMEEIAQWFAQSPEYEARYAGMSFSHFLDQLYADVLQRPADPAGKQYWLDLLEQGAVTRGTIVMYFTESDEMRSVSARRSEVVGLSLVRHGRVPAPGEVEAWTALRDSRSPGDAVAAWYGS